MTQHKADSPSTQLRPSVKNILEKHDSPSFHVHELIDWNILLRVACRNVNKNYDAKYFCSRYDFIAWTVDFPYLQNICLTDRQIVWLHQLKYLYRTFQCPAISGRVGKLGEPVGSTAHVVGHFVNHRVKQSCGKRFLYVPGSKRSYGLHFTLVICRVFSFPFLYSVAPGMRILLRNYFSGLYYLTSLFLKKTYSTSLYQKPREKYDFVV